MHRIVLCAAALAAAPLAQAQQPSPATSEAIKALEQRVDELEAQVQAAQARPRQQNALNPAISAILNGVYANLSKDPATYRINGFVPTMGEVGPPPRGFGLGESELGVSSSIDPWFRGALIAAIAPDNDKIGIEEAYLETLRLPRGFTAKAGRFFSAIGYQNRIHAHAWDFTDAPLVMDAFLGGQRNEDGVQLRWLAPTDTYWDMGVELGRGRAFPASLPESGKNGAGSVDLFTNAGGDLGPSWAWQAGLSHLRTNPSGRRFEDAGSTDSFTGSSRLWALSGVVKWAPNGNATTHNLKLQGEYFRRTEDGTLVFDAPGAALPSGYASRQSGWYAQGVYQFMPQWRAGYRYDQLDAGDVNADPSVFPILASYKPKKHTVMVDWSPSEFSRIRLQLARDYSRRDEPDTQLFLQYIVSLGAHGAHTF